MTPDFGQGHSSLLKVGGPMNHTGNINLIPDVPIVQLLYTILGFNKGALVKINIIRKAGAEKTYYTLAEILTTIKKVIVEEKFL